MRLFIGGFLVIVLAAAQNAAGSEGMSPEEAAALQLLQTMPACGLQCLTTALAASPCPVGDLTCSCSNATITGQVALCVEKSCSLKESLTTKNISSTLCQIPVRDNTSVVILAAMIGCGIAVLAFILRMISRAVGEGTFLSNSGLDDILMGVALVIVVGISSCSVLLAEHGLGKDIWTVPFDHITYVLHVYYFDEILYLIALPMIKVSLLVTYLRLFPHEKFRLVAYIVIGFNICYAIAFIVVTTIQCTPISYAWTRWDGEHEGTCTHINAQVFAAAGINILLDIIIVIMPMPILWGMNMNIRKKIMIIFMFAVGFFVTVVSILRLNYLVTFGDSHNLTWDYVKVGYWSTIEMHTSVLCACMPGIRRLFKVLWPRLMGATTKSSRRTNDTDEFSAPKAIGSESTFDMKAGSNVRVSAKSNDTSNFIPLPSLDSKHKRNFSYPRNEPASESTEDIYGNAFRGNARKSPV